MRLDSQDFIDANTAHPFTCLERGPLGLPDPRGQLRRCIAVQVFCAGLAVLVSSQFWPLHVLFGHAFGGFALLMALTSLFARLPRAMVLASFGLVCLYGVQYLSVGSSVGWTRALHAANALALFWSVTTLWREALRLER